MAVYGNGKLPQNLLPPKRIDGIYRKPKMMTVREEFTAAAYNYWGKIPDKTNKSPRLQLPDYFYEEKK